LRVGGKCNDYFELSTFPAGDQIFFINKKVRNTTKRLKTVNIVHFGIAKLTRI